MKKYLMGTIIGDIVGSRFEFDNIKSKDFTLFTKDCTFTDDTVMTLAVAKSFTDFGKMTNQEHYKAWLVKVMHEVGKKYPNSGYGGRFRQWIMNDKTGPYNSFGNGSAMRVSPVAWVSDSLKMAEVYARSTAEVTHNHPEGIKGTVATAGAIFLAREGKSKTEIKAYMEKYYNLGFTIDEIRPTYSFSEICQTSVPQAFEAFLEGESFEDVIRLAVSIGGDSDTIAAIAGSIAEAFYGVPEDLAEAAEGYLDDYLKGILDEFERFANNPYVWVCCGDE